MTSRLISRLLIVAAAAAVAAVVTSIQFLISSS